MTLSALDLLVVLTGPAAGSFVALLADRLPRGEAVVLTRSRCRSCDVTLGARDLVPVLSWILRRGRCARCGAPIPGWLVQAELAGFGLGIAAVLLTDDGLQTGLAAGVLWCLLALILTDLRHFRLPDVLTAALFVLGVGLTLAGAGPLDTTFAPADRLAAALLGAALGAGSFAALRWGYRRYAGREGLGAGDVKLIAGLGAMLGPFALPHVALLAGVSALVIAAARAGRRKRKLRAGQALPFGAFLAASAVALWIGGRLVA